VLTPEDYELQAVTKHKWMSAHDNNSTIGNLAFRIDGIAGSAFAGMSDLSKELPALRTAEDIRDLLMVFIETVAGAFPESCEYLPLTALQLAEQFHMRLLAIYRAMCASLFVKQHECIGSSLLAVVESNGRCTFSWIDFAKTTLKEGAELSHRTPWVIGNHEDGILLGVENLLSCSSAMLDELRKEVSRDDSGSMSPDLFVDVDKWTSAGSATPQQDLKILSSVPTFSGCIADSEGHLWASGYARVKAAVAGVMRGHRKSSTSLKEASLGWKPLPA